MDTMQKVFEFVKLNNLFSKKKNVGVGISGGADSVFLLTFLNKYKNVLGVEQIVGIHVNHNLRGKESDEDEKFVKNLCESYGNSCAIYSVDVKKKCNTDKIGEEESARLLRYKSFEDAKRKYDLDIICLAHHENDQAETVLMHIFRGAGLAGACGMMVENNGFLRPLLCISRHEIEEYLIKEKISYRDDSTNKDTNYVRNYIRNEVINKIEKVYPNAVNNICDFSLRCQNDIKFIDKVITKYIEEENGKIYVSKDVNNLDEGQRFRVYLIAFKKAGASRDIESKHLKMVDELFRMKTASSLDFPMNMQAIKEYNKIIIQRKEEVEDFEEVSFQVPQRLLFKNTIIETKFVNSQDVIFGENSHYVDYMKIPENAVWRIRKDADIFSKLGSGSKKLNDYFTNKKIPKAERDKMLLLATKNVVLDIPGLDVSELVKIDSMTEKIVQISIKK